VGALIAYKGCLGKSDAGEFDTGLSCCGELLLRAASKFAVLNRDVGGSEDFVNDIVGCDAAGLNRHYPCLTIHTAPEGSGSTLRFDPPVRTGHVAQVDTPKPACGRQV
jgi:hypothetical protein